MQKYVISVLEPFFSFMLSFQLCKVHNMLALMLDPQHKGLRKVIQYVGKQRAFQITNAYDRKYCSHSSLCIQDLEPYECK